MENKNIEISNCYQSTGSLLYSAGIDSIFFLFKVHLGQRHRLCYKSHIAHRGIYCTKMATNVLRITFNSRSLTEVCSKSVKARLECCMEVKALMGLDLEAVLYQPLDPTPRAVSASRPNPSCCISLSTQPLVLYQPLDPTPHAVSASRPNPSCCISLSTQPLVLYQPLDPTPRTLTSIHHSNRV